MQNSILSSLMNNETSLDVAMKNLISRFIDYVMQQEREVFLRENPQEKGNGFYHRNFNLSTIPLELHVPTTRTRNFKSALLPAYQRCLPEYYENIMTSFILSSRSIESAKSAVQMLGLPYSKDAVDMIAENLYNHAKTINSRQLACDYIAVFIDAKIVDVKDDSNVLKKGVLFTVVGSDTNALKSVLAFYFFFGNENIDNWKSVFNSLKNRGLTRVSLITTDDFSGFSPIVSSIFPKSFHQLCSVHLMRNAQRHLSKDDYSFFKQTWSQILATSSFDSAYNSLIALCDQLQPKYSSFIKNIRNKADKFLAFMHYPSHIRPELKSTNLSESINKELEKLRRNSGGYFHSQHNLIVKLAILETNISLGRWPVPGPKLKSCLSDILTIFKNQFETEEVIT